MDIKNGNLITPKGASLIFGKEVKSDDKTELAQDNKYTYSPYTIVITEEDDDNNSYISASEINFNNDQSGLSSTNVQGAIEEVKTSIDGLKTDLGGLTKEFVEYNSENGFQIATNAITAGKSLWIRISADIITPSMTTGNTIYAPLSCYNLSGDGKINYCDFKVSHEGYNRIARVGPQGWELSKDYSGGNDFVIYRWEEEN